MPPVPCRVRVSPRTVTTQHGKGFLNLNSVANALPQGLIHIRDECDGFLAHSAPGLDHQVCKECRVLIRFHERAGASFYVEHQAIDSLRQFLAHDGREIREGLSTVPVTSRNE